MKIRKHLFENLADTKTFTNDTEIVRLAIIAELDAVNLYNQLASKTKNEVLKKVLLDVALEEKVHVEEFSKFLDTIDNKEVDGARQQAEKEMKELT